MSQESLCLSWPNGMAADFQFLAIVILANTNMKASSTLQYNPGVRAFGTWSG